MISDVKLKELSPPFPYLLTNSRTICSLKCLKDRCSLKALTVGNLLAQGGQ